jgi:hypothetical protein
MYTHICRLAATSSFGGAVMLPAPAAVNDRLTCTPLALSQHVQQTMIGIFWK